MPSNARLIFQRPDLEGIKGHGEAENSMLQGSKNSPQGRVLTPQRSEGARRVRTALGLF